MATNEVIMERMFGLDPDAAHMAYTGFGGGELFGNPARPTFSRAYEAFRDDCESQGIDEGQSTQPVWLPESIAGDVGSAILNAVTTDGQRTAEILFADPPYRGTSPELAKAVTEHVVASVALIRLGTIASYNATLRATNET